MSAVPASAGGSSPAPDSRHCFHCGLPLSADGGWSVSIDNVERAMCCPGCAAVARTIVANGLTDYYLTRAGFSEPADRQPAVPPELALYDTPEAIRQFAQPSGGNPDLCDAVFSVEGIRCGACVWLIERRLARVPGVRMTNLNVAAERLHVQWQKDSCKPSDILAAMREIGYRAYPYDVARHGEQLRRAGKTLFRQLFVAALSMMQVMMYAIPAYLADGTLDAGMSNLMRWASLLLTIPAVFYAARPFFRGAWMDLRHAAPGMDVPVALGIAVAFIGSCVATWRGEGEVYFDSVTMFIFLLLCSRYLELLARRKAASALEKLQHALPEAASRLPAYPASRLEENIAAVQLREGDIILIKPGDAVAADCMIVEGASAIDLSLLSGESRPVPKTVGDILPGGAVNATQAVVARVLKPVQESTLSALVKLIERAGQSKPQLAQRADKVAAWFVAALLLLAIGVFGLWHWIDPARAWPVAIAVLVVSCPCALSLATPTALAAATDRLMRQGVLVVQPHVLETLQRATHVIFDKTGTLTNGKPSVRRIDTFGTPNGEHYLQIAAALEAHSAHPLGIAIVDAAQQSAQQLAQQASAARLAVNDVREVQYVAGQGLEGLVQGKRFRLGSARFVEEITRQPPTGHADDGSTAVYLGSGSGWHARFDLIDTVRADARQVVEHFQASGKTVILLSGDRRTVTRRIADELGIRLAHGDCLPARKVEFVQALQAAGAVVAMVGDGINDAAVMRAADVSFAMGSGAALAQAHADTVLLSGRLASVWEAAKTASQTMAVIRQNLMWAVLYNAVAIPAAAAGLLNPWWAGIGMSLSSGVVVLNALRLRRIRPAAREYRGTPPPACSLAG